jgi:hypothetical protein
MGFRLVGAGLWGRRGNILEYILRFGTSCASNDDLTCVTTRQCARHEKPGYGGRGHGEKYLGFYKLEHRTLTFSQYQPVW